MSTFSVEEVTRLAELARIDLSAAEIERLAGELAIIADAASHVSEIATPEVTITLPSIPLENVTRLDETGEVLDREQLLAAAPAAEHGMFRVPQILEED